MKRGYALTALILCATSIAYCDELPIHSPIESIALFKTGLAVVRRSIDFPGPGAYRLDDVIEPVHGTRIGGRAAAVVLLKLTRGVSVTYLCLIR